VVLSEVIQSLLDFLWHSIVINLANTTLVLHKQLISMIL